MKLKIKNTIIKRIEAFEKNKDTNKMVIRKFPMLILEADKYNCYLPIYRVNTNLEFDNESLFNLFVKEGEKFTVYNKINQAKKECNTQELINIFGLELIEEIKNADEF